MALNIFLLHDDIKICAQSHCNRHTVSQIKEYCQLLSTAHRVLDGILCEGFSKSGRKRNVLRLDDHRDEILYRETHINHPSAIWVRENSSNYLYLHKLLDELNKEYTHRYQREHKSITIGLVDILSHLPINITKSAKMSPMPQCMPDEFKVDGDSVKAYQNYYIGAKHSILQYKRREIPKFLSSIGLGEQV